MIPLDMFTKAMSGIKQTAIRLGAGQELTDVLARLTEIDDETARLEQEIDDAKSQFAQFDDELTSVQKKIDDALARGDREKLQRDLAHNSGMTRHVSWNSVKKLP